MISVSQQTLHFIEGLEGCSLKAYLDSRGIWTIGVGMTELYGRPVKPSDVITQTQADQLFGAGVQYTQNHVIALIKPVIYLKLTANQITALTSLAYNIGLGGFSASLVLRELNAGNFKASADAFRNWERAGDDAHILAERREKERSLFLS